MTGVQKFMISQGSSAVSETPTAQLRYINGNRLQQVWVIATYDGGVIDSQRTEWRDVPVEQPD